MIRTIELEYETTMGIFDLDVTLKGDSDGKGEFTDPDLKSITCGDDIADLLIAANFDINIVQDILEKAWEKDRRTK